MSGIVTDSRGNPVLDGSGNPVRKGTPEAAKVKPGKLGPEQKKLIQSLNDGIIASSVTSEQEIQQLEASGNGALANTLRLQNEEIINSLPPGTQPNLNEAQASFNRATSENTDPNLRPPTRAQDTYSLNQAPAALMTSIPRQKFEYIATFRLTSQSLFEQLFSSPEVDSLDEQITTNENIANQFRGGPPGRDSLYRQQAINLSNKRTDVMNSIRRSLVFNVRSVDGPKVTFQYDTLNQYNRKRNVYRRVDYDPINIRFYDTFNNSAVKLWQYLYESTVKDGQNKSYGATNATEIMKKFNPYEPNALVDETTFMQRHNFGIQQSSSDSTYPIKSLDLLLVHGKRYNLIRFIHPRIIAMDHDAFSYEASGPVEIGMQFAYETVLYETLNHDFDDPYQDLNVDLKELFATADMPDTPATGGVADEGKSAANGGAPDWTKMTTSIPDEQTVRTLGTGTNLMNGGSFAGFLDNIGAAFQGGFATGTPISDSIDAVAQEVYGSTRSAVSSFAAGLSGNATNNSANAGSVNVGNRNWRPGYTTSGKDAKGSLTADKNGNITRNNIINSSGYDAKLAAEVKARSRTT